MLSHSCQTAMDTQGMRNRYATHKPYPPSLFFNILYPIHSLSIPHGRDLSAPCQSSLQSPPYDSRTPSESLSDPSRMVSLCLPARWATCG